MTRGPALALVLLAIAAASAAAQPTPTTDGATTSQGAAAAPAPQAAAPSLERVRALRSAGFRDLAIAELQAFIKARPGPVPLDLADLLPTPAQRWNERLRREVVPAVELVLQIAVPVGLGLLLVRHRWRHRRTSSVNILEFEATGVEWPIGKTMSALVQHTLTASRSARRSSLDLVTAPVEPPRLPADVVAGMSTLVPTANVLSALGAWTMPSSGYQITGALHRIGSQGAGLTVSITRQKQVLETVTLWQSEFDQGPRQAEPAAYFTLAEPAALWAYFALRRRLDGNPAFRWGGTADWKSYALFRAGQRLERLKRPLDAREMYVRALSRDPRNCGARVSLGALLMGEGNNAAAIDQFVAATSKADEIKNDPALYSGLYLLATAQYVERDAGRALISAGQLVRFLDDQTATPDPGNEALESFLTPLRPAAVSMYAALLAIHGRALEADRRMSSFDASTPLPEAQFNLACFYSMRASLRTKVTAARRQELLEKALASLALALSLKREYVAAAQADRCLDEVRKDPSTRDRFARLVGTTQGTPAATSKLATLSRIGPLYAEKLAKAGVTSPADLVVAGADRVAAVSLALTLGVAPETVTRWARSAELLRVRGMQPEHVNVLGLAGIDSLNDLRRRSASSVVSVFRDWSPALNVAPPSPQQIEEWVLEISALSPLV